MDHTRFISTRMPHFWRAAAPVGATAVLVASLAGGAPAALADSAQAGTVSAATVNIDSSNVMSTVAPTAIGLNTSVYDSNMTDEAVPGLLRDAGVRLLRFPGGSVSDEYNWKDNTDVVYGNKWAVDFDQFMTLVRQVGAQAMVTVNYGTGDTMGSKQSPAETGPQVAADWVYYANVLHHYNVRYWEIGNEIYGNGTYGANWEEDDHCQVSSSPSAAPFNPAGGALSPETLGSYKAPTFDCGPATYAANVARYIDAMKAVDPNIVVGVVLTTPYNWPDDADVGYICGSGASQIPDCYWDATVLKDLGNRVGFADIHWYPQNPSNVTAYQTPPLANGAPGNPPTDAGLLKSTTMIPQMVTALRQRLGAAGASDVPIMVTETNSVSSNPGKQTVSVVNALYLEQDYLNWLENGALNVDWWQLHNGIVTTGDNGPTDNASNNPNAPDLYGDTLYGDYGLLSNGSCGTAKTTSGGTQVCEPPADTPFPAYYGLKVLSHFVRPGDQLLGTVSNQPLVQAYSAAGPGQERRVLLVNDDPVNSYSVSLTQDGRPANVLPNGLVYGAAVPQPTYVDLAPASTVTLPPYTIEVVGLQRGSGRR